MIRPLVARLSTSNYPSRSVVRVASAPPSLALLVLRAAGIEDVAEWHEVAPGFIVPKHFADTAEQTATTSGVPVRRRVRKA